MSPARSSLPISLTRIVVEIGQQVGDRRIDRDLAELLEILALGARREKAFGEDVGVALALGAVGGQQHLAMLFEVQQPVGQLEIVDVEQLAAALERGRIFAVRVDHDDVTLGRQLRNAVEDQRDRGRLTGTGRSEDREMLRQHRVDVERAADVVGRIDGADFDVRAVVGGEDRPHVLGRDRKDRRRPGSGSG